MIPFLGPALFVCLAPLMIWHHCFKVANAVLERVDSIFIYVQGLRRFVATSVIE